MPSLKEYLLQNVDDISCTACGNCCPPDCNSLTKENLCKSHPLTTNSKDTRPFACQLLEPATLAVFYGYICPPIADLIKELTHQSVAISNHPVKTHN